jgi:TorA maturation chaperone TorD
MSDDPERLLYQSLVLRVLAKAYACPDDAFQSAVMIGDFSSALRSGVTCLGNPRLRRPTSQLHRAVSALSTAEVTLKEEYTALFQRKVRCSPYASRYLAPGAAYRTRVLEEVATYYRALGVTTAADHPDLPDHIGAELEFLALAAAREYQARQTDDEAASYFRDLRRRFCTGHLALWLPTFRDRLAEHARLDFYPAVTDVAMAMLDVDPLAPAVAEGPLFVDSQETYLKDGSDESGTSFPCGLMVG